MNQAQNLEDVTFLIPVRIDTIDRLENIQMVVEFLLKNFKTNIHILEAAAYNNQILSTLLHSNVSITYIEDHDPVFHRTKYINQLVDDSITSYLAIWDTDVIIPPKQIIKSVESLRNNEADFIYPYKDNFFDTSKIIRELYLKTGDLDSLTENTGKMKKLYLPNPVGGAFLVNRNSYIESGMENEQFYGWGREDGDRINRWKILEYEFARIPGPLFHLTHHRGFNSGYHADQQRNIKHSEILRIISMSREELRDEIESWNS